METSPMVETPTRWFRFKKKSKKILLYSVVILVFILSIGFYWKYCYSYSEGYKTGVLVNFVHKGYVFKTAEGELLIVGNQALNINNEKFIFSVDKKSVRNQLDTLQGRTLLIHFVQKNGRLFWQGESMYIVDSVKLK